MRDNPISVIIVIFFLGVIVGGTIMAAMIEQPAKSNSSAYDEAAATCIELGGVPIQAHMGYGDEGLRLEKCQFKSEY